MRETRIGSHRVSIYESIDELPMKRFHKYNKMLLIDAGIGSDIQSFDAHIEKVVRYVRNGDVDDAAKELENMRQNVYLIQTEQSPSNLSFAVLVSAIDGKACEDLTDEGLERVRALLSDAMRKETNGILSEVKKKIDAELQEYFPDMFVSTREKEYYDDMKRLAVAQLEQVAEGTDEGREKRIRELTDRLVLAIKPKEFTGRNAFGVRHDKEYERMCLMISANTGVDAKRMTVMEYYTATEYMADVAKERRKQLSKALK